jgi:hypothetical protein
MFKMKNGAADSVEEPRPILSGPLFESVPAGAVPFVDRFRISGLLPSLARPWVPSALLTIPAGMSERFGSGFFIGMLPNSWPTQRMSLQASMHISSE